MHLSSLVGLQGAATDSQLRATIIAGCKEHEKRMWLDNEWRACVTIGEQYFVKFGSLEDMECERRTQSYIFDYTQQCHLDSQDTPRIAKILDHFFDESECIMYLVLEYIKLRKSSPPDLDDRIHKALLWLSEVPLPPNQWLGPVGRGPIRHKFFRDYAAPFPIPDLATLNEYIQKAYNRLPPAARRITPTFSILGERVMFTQSDMDVSNFGVDENDRTVLMDFSEIGVVPETFIASTLGTSHSVVSALGLPTSNGYSMAAIRASLGMCANTTLGMDKKILRESTDIKSS